MRLYTFCNMYLSSIQHGIQTAHIVGEFDPTDSAFDEWRRNHKTIIVCNGGNSKALIELRDFFNESGDEYTYSFFREDFDSLENSITAVGIILPASIYEAVPIYNYDKTITGYMYNPTKIYPVDSYEFELIKRIKSYKLSN